MEPHETINTICDGFLFQLVLASIIDFADDFPGACRTWANKRKKNLIQRRHKKKVNS